jgi:hypothetical protein
LTWFTDNKPDSGVLGIIASVTAAEASSSVDGRGESDTTIRCQRGTPALRLGNDEYFHPRRTLRKRMEGELAVAGVVDRQLGCFAG